MLIAFSFRVSATPDTSTLSLHDALPIYFGARGRERAGVGGVGLDLIHRRVGVRSGRAARGRASAGAAAAGGTGQVRRRDRKSTRLNSSHVKISYAVFCLKKKIQVISTDA